MIGLIAALAASASTAALQPALQPWSSLVGHCWSGDAPGGGGTDKHCFESVYGGQHIRDRHSVVSNGRSIYAGETLYSVRGRKVIFTYWNSLGGVGTGEAVSDGSQIRFTGMIHATPEGAEQPFAATWRKGDAGYEVLDAPNARPRPFTRAD